MCRGVLTNTHMRVLLGCAPKHTHTHMNISPWDHFCIFLTAFFHRQTWQRLEVDFGFSRRSQEDCGGACEEAKIPKTPLIG